MNRWTHAVHPIQHQHFLHSIKYDLTIHYPQYDCFEILKADYRLETL